MKEHWWQALYARFVGFLVRRSWRTCIHGNDLVLNLEGPYPMCSLCCEQVLKEQSDEIIERYAEKIVELHARADAREKE